MRDCIQLDLGFNSELPIHVRFDAPNTSSDGGALLLRQVDDRLELTSTFAPLIPDARDPLLIEHTRQEQLRQRLIQICLGYEDCNDATFLRTDSVLKLACNRLPGSGELSSQPTLSRLENAVDMKSIRRMVLELEERYVASLGLDPEVVILDIDTTDDATYGDQQLTFFHGFYDHYMYHPLFVFDGESGRLVTAVLRPGNAHAARGAAGVLRRIIRRLKKRYPKTQIVVRGDAGFSMPRLMDMLDQMNEEYGGVDYLFGIAKNPVLLRLGQATMDAALQQTAEGRSYVRNFESLRYAAATWSRERLVVMKAEVTEKGENPRFVVTSVEGFSPQDIYDAYCERGQCENFIKDFKNALKADRLSCSSFTANFFRLLEHALAYVLMHALREHVGQHAPALASAQMDTLRLRLLKVAAHVTRSARRVLVQMPRSFPLAAAFAAINVALITGGT